MLQPTKKTPLQVLSMRKDTNTNWTDREEEFGYEEGSYQDPLKASKTNLETNSEVQTTGDLEADLFNLFSGYEEKQEAVESIQETFDQIAEAPRNPAEAAAIEENPELKDRINFLRKEIDFLERFSDAGKAQSDTRDLMEQFKNSSNPVVSAVSSGAESDDNAVVGFLKDTGKSVMTALSFLSTNAINFTRHNKHFGDEEQKQLDAYKKELADLYAPYREQEKQKIRQEYELLKEKYDLPDLDEKFGNLKDVAYSVIPTENADKSHIANTYRKMLDAIDLSSPDAGGWEAFTHDRVKLLDLAKDIGDAWNVSLHKDGDSRLSPLEEERLKARARLNQINQEFRPTSTLTKLGQGLNTNLQVMGDIVIGNNLAGKAVKNITKKALKEGTSLVLQSALTSPMTWKGTLNNYAENAEIVEDENGEQQLVTSDLQREKIASNIGTMIGVVNGHIYDAEQNGENTVDLQRLKKGLSLAYENLTNEDGGVINKEKSLGESYFKAATETLKETAAEKFVGGFSDKYLPSIGTLVNNRIGRATGMKWLNSKWIKATEATNKLLSQSGGGLVAKQLYSHVGHAKMVNSLPSEMLEELAVQMTPTYGEDYVNQLSELQKGSWYADVALSTLLTTGVMNSVGAAGHYSKLLTNKNYRDSYKQTINETVRLNKLFSNINNAVSNEEVADNIAMGTMGTGYDYIKYMSNINRIRTGQAPEYKNLSKEEREEKARQLEKRALPRIILNSIATGTDKDMVKAFENLSKNMNVTQSVRENASNAVAKYHNIKDILLRNNDKVNGDTLTDLEISSVFLKDGISDLKEKHNKDIENFRELFDTFNKERQKNGEFTTDLTSLMDNLNEVEKDAVKNQYFADVYDRFKDNVYFNTLLDSSLVLFEVNNHMKKLQEKIDYEKSPANQKAIEERERKKQYANINERATVQPESITKEELRKVKATPEEINAVNEKILSNKTNKVEVTQKPIEAKKSETKLPQTNPDVDSYLEEEAGNIDNTGALDALFASGKPATVKNENISNQAENVGEQVDNAIGDLFAQNTADNIFSNGQFQPITKDPENESHSKAQESLNSLVANIKARNPRNLTFSGFIASMYNSPKFGEAKTDSLFDFLVDAWNNSFKDTPVSQEEAKRVYDSFFVPIDLLDGFTLGAVDSGASTIVSENKPKTIEQEKATEKILTNIKREDVNIAPDDRRFFDDSGIKLGGWLGQDYVETEDGHKTTVSNTINENAKPFLDPRNFKKGDTVTLTFDFDYILSADKRDFSDNPITIYRNADSFSEETADRPYREVLSWKQYMQEVSEKNNILYDKILSDVQNYLTTGEVNETIVLPEILDYLSVSTINKNYTDSTEDKIIGGLHSVAWFNVNNVALPQRTDGQPAYLAQREMILKHRESTRRIRKAILENNNSFSLTVKENRATAENKVLDPTILNPLSEQFKTEEKDLFNEETALGIFRVNAANKIEFTKDNGKPLMFQGVAVMPHMIENYQELQNLNLNGHVAHIVKVGEKNTPTGIEPVFAVRKLITNHKGIQGHNKGKNNIYELLNALGMNPKQQSHWTPEKIKVFKDAWKKTFGFEINRETLNMLEYHFPKVRKKEDGTNEYYMDYKSKYLNAFPNIKEIPDLNKIESVEQLFNILVSQEGNKMTVNNNAQTELKEKGLVGERQKLFASKLHSPSIYTPLTKNNETIFTSRSQNVVILEDNFSNNVDERELQEYENRLAKIKAQKEKEAENSDVAKKELKQITQKQEEIQKTKEVVTVKEKNNGSDEVEEKDLFEITKIITSKTLARLDISENNNVLLSSLLSSAKDVFEEYLQELRTKGKNNVAEYLESKKDQILGLNGQYDNSIREYLDLELDIDTKDIETEALVEENVNEKDYTKASYEVNIRESLSLKLKLAFSGIANTKAQPLSFGEQPVMNSSEVFAALHKALSLTNDNSYEGLKKSLENLQNKNDKELAFFGEIIRRLEFIQQTQPELVQQLLYNLYQPKLNMKFTMFSRNELDGKLVVEVFDTNSNNGVFTLRQQFTHNFMLSPLFLHNPDGTYKIDKSHLGEVDNLFTFVNNLFNEGKVQEIENEALEALFQTLGVNVPQKIISQILNPVTEEELTLTKTVLGNNGIIATVLKNLEDISKQENIPFSFNSLPGVNVLNPLTFNNGQLNDLIKAIDDIDFKEEGVARVGGKNVYMYQQHNVIHTKIKQLKEDLKNLEETGEITGELKKLLDTPVTSNSFWLQMFQRNPKEFSNFLDTYLVGLEALKEKGSESQDNRGLNNLSEQDYWTSIFGIYSHNYGKYEDSEIFDSSYGALTFRKGMTHFPALSDSSQTPLITTLHLNVNENLVKADGNGITEINEYVLDLLRTQLVESDLIRIADYMLKVEFQGVKNTGIEFYDDGVKFIHGIPNINSLLLTVNINGEPTKRMFATAYQEYVKEMYAKNPEITTQEILESFIEKYKEEINNSVLQNVNVEYKNLQKHLKNSGFLREGNFPMEIPTSPEIFMSEFVINNMLHQKEIQTIFAGDLSYYFKSKRAKNLEGGLPKISFKNILDFYYKDRQEEFFDLVKGYKIAELPQEIKDEIKEKFPELRYTAEVGGTDFTAQEAYEHYVPVVNREVINMFKDVKNNLSKRLKKQISPGNLPPNLKDQPPYLQVIVSDIENTSVDLAGLVSRKYPQLVNNKYTLKNGEFKQDGSGISFSKLVQEFVDLDNKFALTDKQKQRRDELNKFISSLIPDISAYMKAASTDAQEYTTWKEHLDYLKGRGKLSESRYQYIKGKFEKQSEDIKKYGTVKKENQLTPEELKEFVMQPIKPLYSGSSVQNINGHTIDRHMYVKSSSFPLIPELTQHFPKLNKRRVIAEQLQEQTGKNVRIAFSSAVKVGGAKSPISIRAFDQMFDRGNGKLLEEDKQAILSSSVELSRDNFYIQQDVPFEADHNAEQGKKDYITRMTQFEKIILGDVVTTAGKIFSTSHFDKDFLKELGIEGDKIDGKQLQQIYTEVYNREQKERTQNLYRKLGISSLEDIYTGNPKTMQKLAKEINKRLAKKQDREFVKLIYTIKDGDIYRDVSQEEYVDFVSQGGEAVSAKFKLPIWLNPNSRKFESVLNSIVNKNNINLKVPGYHFVVASQEGFDFNGYTPAQMEVWRQKGMIFHKNFDPAIGLKPNQVFMASKFKTFNKDTGAYEYIDLTQYVDEKGYIDTNKLPQELLELFSARIPTSAHQSGNLVEIAGFLPHTMGDLLIVSKDSTIQLGEDYDVDKRYMYQYNYIDDGTGKLKKLGYEDIGEKPEMSIKDLRLLHKQNLEDLWNKYYERKTKIDTNNPLGVTDVVYTVNPYWYQRKEQLFELSILEHFLETRDINEFLKSIYSKELLDDMVIRLDDESTFKQIEEKIRQLKADLIPDTLLKEKNNELREEYKKLKDEIIEEFKNKESELYLRWDKYTKAIEYKYSEIEVLENQFIAIHKAVFGTEDVGMRNTINAVLNTDFAQDSAELIQSSKETDSDTYTIYSPTLQFDTMKAGADGKIGIGAASNAVTFNSLLQQIGGVTIGLPKMVLGKFEVEPTIGKIYDLEGTKTSEYLMQSQNSATDNQKLEIMSKRNENAITMNVLYLMQQLGLEKDGIKIKKDTNDKGSVYSYASLFLSQPVLIDYVNYVTKAKSIINTGGGNAEGMALESILKDLDITPEEFENISLVANTLDSAKLFEMLGTDKSKNKQSQAVILKAFLAFKSVSTNLNKMQKIMNIERDGLGISTLSTALKRQEIINLLSKSGSQFDYGIEDRDFVKRAFGEVVKEEAEGYVNIIDTDLWIKPATQYSAKIIHSINNGYTLWKTLIPYSSDTFQTILQDQIQNERLEGSPAYSVEEKQRRLLEGLKTYLYSYIPTFSDIDRKDLFEGENSLAVYLLQLKNNPEYSELMSLNFFKDLYVTLGTGGNLSTIKHRNNNKTKIYNAQTYNTLKGLVNSEKPLPDRGNKKMTEGELMRELLFYSLTVEQDNGATGFRSELPVELFDKHGVTEILNNRSNPDLPTSNVAMLGVVTAANKALQKVGKDKADAIVDYYNKINQKLTKEENALYFNGVNIISKSIQNTTQTNMNRFLKQYYQHNPEMLPFSYFAPGTLEKFNGVQDISTLKYVFTPVKDDRDNEFTVGTVVRLPAQQGIFEVVDVDLYSGLVTLKRLDILGKNGISEYNIYKDVDETAYNNKKYVPISRDMIGFIKDFNSPQGLVNAVFNNSQSKYYGAMQFVKQFYGNVNVSFVDNLKAAGAFTKNPDSSLHILLNKDYLDNLSEEKIEKLIFEESFHSIVIDVTDKYLKFAGFIPGKGFTVEFVEGVEIPEEIYRIVNLYKAAIAYYKKAIPNIEQILEQNVADIREGKGVLYDEHSHLYRLTDIQEFMAGLFMLDESFAKQMAQVKYANTNTNILQRAIQSVLRLMQNILPNIRFDSITANVAQEIYDLLTKDKETKSQPVSYQNKAQQNQPMYRTDTSFVDEVLKNKNTKEAIKNLLQKGIIKNIQC